MDCLSCARDFPCCVDRAGPEAGQVGNRRENHDRFDGDHPIRKLGDGIVGGLYSDAWLCQLGVQQSDSEVQRNICCARHALHRRVVLVWGMGVVRLGRRVLDLVRVLLGP